MFLLVFIFAWGREFHGSIYSKPGEFLKVDKEVIEKIPFSHAGLKIEIEAGKDTFVAGEPIGIKCKLINITDDTIYLYKEGIRGLVEGISKVEIYYWREDGNLYRWNTYLTFIVGFKGTCKEESTPIPPHDTIFEWIFPIFGEIKRQFNEELIFPYVGKFRIVIVFKGFTHKDSKYNYLWRGKIRSNEKDIYIDPLKGINKKIWNVLRVQYDYKWMRGSGGLWLYAGQVNLDNKGKVLKKLYLSYPHSSYSPFLIYLYIVYNLFGGIYEDKEMFACVNLREVLNSCEYFLKMYPKHYLFADVCYYYSMALLRKGEKEKAKKYFKIAYKMEPKRWFPKVPKRVKERTSQKTPHEMFEELLKFIK